jgi:transcription initiation factor TFIID subunit 1, fungi type
MSDESNHKLVSRSQPPPLPLGSDDLYDSEDEEAILEGTYRPRNKKLRLDMNDSHLLFVEDSAQRRLASVKRTTDIPRTDKQLEQRYNISNDRAYDLLKENYQSKIRSTIGNLTIDHSMVALRLQSPYYKVKLSKAQMRSHHRPTFVARPNSVITFAKLKQRKKKKDKGKHITQLLSTTKDMTLGDSAGLLLTEYSEEFPLALSNFGMGSKLINYYRKETPEDTNRPKLAVGETNILGVQDRSPFWNFGFVEPGKTVPTLYNRMIRAPVFKHDTASTDFLVIRSTSTGRGQKLFLKPIPNLFVVGQTFPVTGVPGPHSRKVTTASKNRLKMVAFRLLNKNEYHRLQVRDISPHFPDQNEMQNRQRLKEFMEYQRGGEDQSFWKVKTGEILPNEESIRAMISPEDITLLEAMQVGQQHLEDSGYGKTIDDDSVEDQDGMSIEEQIAPWNVTRNFINATQGKAMLQLHGAGDPSTRGEAFSFLRTSMKGGFKAMGESVNEKLDKSKFGGHSYNVAMQQKAYDEEIKRIWYSQAKSLSVTTTEGLQWDEAENNRLGTHEEEQRSEEPSKIEDDEMSLFSHASGISHKTKVLQITRMSKDENGTLQRNTQIVKDPNVIRAYLKRRHEIEDSQIAPEEIAPTNDEEKNRRLKKILLTEKARLERNKERQMARKAEKMAEGKGKGKATTRKCASCGAIGHIRTNKACPLYYETIGAEAPTQAVAGSNSASPAAG